MSCRAGRLSSIDEVMVEALTMSAPYLELARSDRRDDFNWLARSQGLPAEKTGELWDMMRALAAGSPGPKR